MIVEEKIKSVSSLTVRDARIDDLENMVCLHVRNFHAHELSMILGRALVSRFYALVLADETVTKKVLECNGTIVAFSIVFRRYRCFEKAMRAQCFRLLVRRFFQCVITMQWAMFVHMVRAGISKNFHAVVPDAIYDFHVGNLLLDETVRQQPAVVRAFYEMYKENVEMLKRESTAGCWGSCRVSNMPSKRLLIDRGLADETIMHSYPEDVAVMIYHKQRKNNSEPYDHTTVREANRQYYNAVADVYRTSEAYAYGDSIQKDVVRLLTLGAQHACACDTFLDVGCGSGFLSKIVWHERLFKNIVGVDISEKQIQLYQTTLPEHVAQGIVADGTNVPLAAESVDMAASYSVLHHFINYYDVLREITRVLRPGGIVYCDFEPNQQFQKIMALPIWLRRKLFDRAPGKLDNVERIAEYHNHVVRGINRVHLLTFLGQTYDVITWGARYPASCAGTLVKGLFMGRASYAPYFYIIAQKKSG